MDRTQKLSRLSELVARHAASEGATPTAIEGVHVFRADGPSPVRCAIYNPCVIIVAQGRKRANLGDEQYEYSPARYLVLPVALPIDAQVVEATAEQPFLSFAIQVDAPALDEIVAETDQTPFAAREVVRGIAVSETTDDLLDAAVRLLSCLDSAADCRVLAPHIKREILYRVLTGPQGDLLKGMGHRDARLRQVSRALDLIHSEYERPLQVAELARTAHMSASAFFDAFKSVTSLSPIQYVKEIRLNRARQIMIWEGASAKRAARRVGYVSASQFSREFKRRFGRPPAKERVWALEAGETRGARPY